MRMRPWSSHLTRPKQQSWSLGLASLVGVVRMSNEMPSGAGSQSFGSGRAGGASSLEQQPGLPALPHGFGSDAGAALGGSERCGSGGRGEATDRTRGECSGAAFRNGEPT